MTDLLSGHEPPVTHDMMLAEIDREAKMRAQVYPRQIAAGRLKHNEAQARNRVLQAIRDLVENAKLRGGSDATTGGRT